MDTDVALRPVTADDLTLFETEFASEAGASSYQWFGHPNSAKLRHQFQETGLLGADFGMLTVESSGRVVGRVEWFPAAWGRPDTSSCWTIAIGLFSDSRGRGLGTSAQRLLCQYLFAHTRAQRVQAFTDVENIPERRALEKVGFALEGVLRSAQWRAGGWHDLVLYSLIRPALTSD